MQPKLKNRYIICTGFNRVGETMCIQFHSQVDPETQNKIFPDYEYQVRDFGIIVDGYSLVNVFLATKPELQRCYQHFQKRYPLLVKGLKANTHPASKALFHHILHYNDV